MWNSRRPTCVAAPLAFLAAASTVRAARRVALVIGNADYRQVPTLATPRNDAADLVDALAADLADARRIACAASTGTARRLVYLS